MATVGSDIKVLTQDWVQKFHFENKVDLNLQNPVQDESIKIEIDAIPHELLPKLDTRQCEKHKRRAGVGRDTAKPITNFYTPLKNIKEAEQIDKKSYIASQDTIKQTHPVSQNTPTQNSSPAMDNAKPQTIPNEQNKPKRSSTVRKTPTLKSYEKHMPNPVYSAQDSIYRLDEHKTNTNDNQPKRSSTTPQQDNYQISWKEEGTGDDLLTSLVTFQTIFEEKGNDTEGLSDLLEQKAKELKIQKLREQQEALKPKTIEELPTRLAECLTISYRHGPPHHPLTLYHTMKMPVSKDRLKAYQLAFQHCINADSGMKKWIKRQRTEPAKENSRLVQPIRRPTIKRSLLHPLSSRKHKGASEDFMIWTTASTDQLGLTVPTNTSILSLSSKKSADFVSSPTSIQEEQLTDVISAAHALLPNQQFSANTTTTSTTQKQIPYEHIDTPSRPRQPSGSTEFKDSSSVSSSESANGGSITASKLKKSAPGRLLSTLGRKTSLRSYSRSKSIEKTDQNETFEKVLTELHHILPHLDRAQLVPYVEEANYDYLTALQLCKAAVLSGKLS
ncbi:hypothetical protein CU098_010761 [Rhizopus stolonifer]|uniref:Uncharacterized protein n=1 Tax=Rhizopus stolonifer TaxID=4846 RepID=A0A367KQE2_RHIST|nr:hypothetical protein CU098_010761 [Rhizopus stolonifer]